MRNSKLKILVLGTVGFGFLILMTACSKDDSNTPADNNNNNNNSNESTVEFVDIPGDGTDILPFKLGKTEVTNQQYVDFLNSAMSENLITVVDESLLL